MGLYDYNPTLCPLQSRLRHIYHGQPYARVDLNPVPETTLSPQSGTLDMASGWWWWQWMTAVDSWSGLDVGGGCNVCVGKTYDFAVV